MIRVTETKRMMATNKPGVVQMKGGAYVILIFLLYVDIDIDKIVRKLKSCGQFLFPVNLVKKKSEVLI